MTNAGPLAPSGGWRVSETMALFGSKPASADRRGAPRKTVNARGVVSAPDLEMACVIADLSAGGMRLRLDRGATLPRTVVVVDVSAGLAYPATVVWQKGQEAGVSHAGSASLRGLTPGRLAGARDAWLRAGGR